MIEQIKHIGELTSLHWALAYTGLLVHIFMKIANMRGTLRNSITRKFVMTTVASFLLIPAILLICTDTSMKDLLPINYMTAFLAGYQTQSLVLNITAFSTKSLNNESNNI